MASSKLRKISKIVKEITIENTVFNYDISGLDLSLCKFYYRTPEALFQDLPLGDYTIDKSSNNQTLVIQNDNIISTGEAIQICYELDLSSSKYESDFEIDINRLASSYNEAIDDLHNLWNYIKSVNMIADDTTMNIILPNLPKHCVWCMGENGEMFALPVDELYNKFQNLVDRIYEETKKLLTVDYNKFSNDLKTQTEKHLQSLSDLKLECENAIKEKGDEQLKRLEKAIDNVADQQYNYRLLANENTITLPDTWIFSNYRDKVYIDGILIYEDLYEKSGNKIILKNTYPYDTNVFVNSALPVTYVEEQVKDFYKNIEIKTNEFNDNATSKTNKFNENANSKTVLFDKNSVNKTDTFNKNSETKTNEFNDNSVNKTDDFNNNAIDKNNIIKNLSDDSLSKIRTATSQSISDIEDSTIISINKGIREINAHVVNVSQPSIDSYVETNVKNKINDYTTLKKQDLDDYTNTVKQRDIDDYVVLKQKELDTYVKNDKFNQINIHVNNKKNELDDYMNTSKVEIKTELENNLNKYEKVKEKELDTYVENTSKPNIDSYVTTKENEIKGATFTPSVSESGDISFTNDKGLPNPPTVNIKGVKGDPGNFIFKVENGHLILYTVDNGTAPSFSLENGHLMIEIN